MESRNQRKSFDIRGLMLDPARLTERHEFYFDLLPRLAEWGYNTLWWHFCDDEGCALKLASHPELASPYALSKAETRRLIEKAGELGIDVVPEVETLGHSLWITRHPQYAHLFNGAPFGHNAVCPSHPDTLTLMTEIVEEVADLFPSPYLHAGLDEARLDDCPRCVRRGRGKPKWWVFSRHVLAMHKLLSRLGKRMIMWADSVEKNPDLLDVLPKDIIQAHWHYRNVPKEKITPTMKAGFETLCVPAVGGVIVQPDDIVAENVAQMVSLAGRSTTRGCRGVVACWWESGRNLRDVYPFAVAYAGKAMRLRRGPNPMTFARSFCKEFFGTDDRSTAAALWKGHQIVPSRQEVQELFPRSLANVHNAVDLARHENFQERLDAAKRCVADLKAGRKKVRKHRAEYGASLVAATISATALRNACCLSDAFEAYATAAACVDVRRPRETALEYLTAALKQLEQCHEATDAVKRMAEAEWNRTRHPRDPKKDGSSPLLRQRGARVILSILNRSIRFQRKLSQGLRHAIVAYRQKGPFPGGF